VNEALDLTGYGDKSDPGSSVAGLGTLPGLKPACLFNPRKPYPIAGADKGRLMIEAEHGEYGWTLDIRKANKELVAGNLQELVVELTAARRAMVQKQFDFYSLPIEWWAFYGGEPSKTTRDELRRAFDCMAKPLLRIVDGFTIDAHCFTQVPVDTYIRSVKARVDLAASYGKPVSVVVSTEWHGKSEDANRAGRPMAESEIVPRLTLLTQLPIARLYLMGGDRNVSVNSNPALPAIVKLLAPFNHAA
jgi:hypothetical protein